MLYYMCKFVIVHFGLWTALSIIVFIILFIFIMEDNVIYAYVALFY